MLLRGAPLPANQTRALQQTLFSILRSCNPTRHPFQVHAQLVVNGFTHKSFILAELVSLYVASGCLLHAHRAFSRSQSPSTIVWNQIIRGHARSDTPRRSVQLYKTMVAAGPTPDAFTYSFVLSACARSGGLAREGEQVHARAVWSGWCGSVFVQTNLVNLYARGSIGDALHLFDEMPVRNAASWNSLLMAFARRGHMDGARDVFDRMPERNVVSWTTMISGCARHGMCKRALSLFGRMRKDFVGMDQVVLVAVLSVCAQLGDLKLGRMLHSYIETMARDGKQEPLVSLKNALIHMYTSCGVVQDAYKVFRAMPQRSTVTWTSMITGLAKQGRAEEALYIFQCMLNTGGNHVRPDEITFIGVLCACSYAGLVDKGRHFFNNMISNWGLVPRIEHYGCMVDVLSRAGLLDEARRFIDAMPMKPSAAVWGALLSGCRIHKNVGLASHVAQNLAAELDPDRAAGYLVLQMNVYAAAKCWRDVAIVRRNMVEMGVRKPRGRSWVHENGIVHDFLAGDRTHKHASEIYEMLGNVTRQAMLHGYKIDTSEVVLDVD